MVTEVAVRSICVMYLSAVCQKVFLLYLACLCSVISDINLNVLFCGPEWTIVLKWSEFSGI